ncbi:putative membrane protein YwzB [Breznakia sp. PF5-3]|uniref:DUF1146 domain-containing protein n=1 Tax=unclassified Breznakia TaxID=2623764 RepID=UPI002406CB0D|nr:MULTISPECIES: DUF1146 domain-containing protein [unclassified Breznakia]MDF9824956.1 putative membrane protein YwzB [Breznakia sp. PM6-1]MDF9835776.1 putative membrane protein YwzB [Breznakia sp. PF5-3]MDF9837930.1 putative membrane protein YwzB [Breznakia sp. PFB2-8]MDF9859919.1 putative membrane protein YwzB [Breznakia sp. PH5-24]
MSVVDFVEYFVYFTSFGLCMYALSSVKFDKFTHVSNPLKVQLLWILLATGLAYIVSQFIFALTIYS